MNHRDRVQCATATTGTGTITLGSASTGYRNFLSAYTGDRIVSYIINDGVDWETGYGSYVRSANTMTRGLLASSTGSALNLSGTATVGVTHVSADSTCDWPVLIASRNAGDGGSFQPLGAGAESGFATIQLNTVSIDTHNGWDASTWTWVVPQTGLYDLQGKIRPVDTDNNAAAYSFGVGLDIANQDSAGFVWQTFPTGAQNNNNRFTGYNSRQMMLTAGQRLRLFGFVDRNNIPLNKAELVATRVR